MTIMIYPYMDDDNDIDDDNDVDDGNEGVERGKCHHVRVWSCHA